MNMNTRNVIAGTLALFLGSSLALRAADGMTTFSARSGSKMRIEGTSNIHDWQVESSIIGGSFQAGSDFPVEPGQAVKPGKVEAHGDIFLTVRSLKSLEKDGKPYSDSMDARMWEKLVGTNTTPVEKIVFQIKELTLKEAAKDKDSEYTYDCTGDLAVAGVTNKVTLPVKVLPMANKKIKITGTTTLKMTDFHIDPPAPKIALSLIKTGDEVKIIFTWMVGPQLAKPAAAAAAAGKN
jgi:hypothetical protein